MSEPLTDAEAIEKARATVEQVAVKVLPLTPEGEAIHRIVLNQALTAYGDLRQAVGAVEALSAIECEMGGPGRYHFVYGGFMGGDPRRFEPDAECCTPDEIARHKAACVEWDAGTGVDRGPGCQTLGDGASVTGAGFGIGTSEYDCDLCGALTAAQAHLDELKRSMKPPQSRQSRRQPHD